MASLGFAGNAGVNHVAAPGRWQILTIGWQLLVSTESAWNLPLSRHQLLVIGVLSTGSNTDLKQVSLILS